MPEGRGWHRCFTPCDSCAAYDSHEWSIDRQGWLACVVLLCGGFPEHHRLATTGEYARMSWAESRPVAETGWNIWRGFVGGFYLASAVFNAAHTLPRTGEPGLLEDYADGAWFPLFGPSCATCSWRTIDRDCRAMTCPLSLRRRAHCHTRRWHLDPLVIRHFSALQLGNRRSRVRFGPPAVQERAQCSHPCSGRPVGAVIGAGLHPAKSPSRPFRLDAFPLGPTSP